MQDTNTARLPRALAAYAAVSALSLLILAWVMALGRADLHIPFAYRHDALFNCALAKGMMENGWWLRNPRLGMPLGQELHDFPMADSLHWGVMRLIGWPAHDWAVAVNLFFLLTFPLAAVCALAAFRQLGLSYPSAAAAGILYAFLPYHFWRGETHLLLSGYYLVPLVAMVSLWVAGDADLLTRPGAAKGKLPLDLRRPRSAAAAAICFLAAFAGVYYALFGAFFIAVGGLLGRRWRGSPGHTLAAVRLIAIILFGLLLNGAPTLVYGRAHGHNPDAVQRSGVEGEYYALKVSQMLLPVTGHRITALARWKDGYNRSAPLVNENDSATLGVVGSLGLLLLLGHAIRRVDGNPSHARVAAALTVAGLLLGSAGGFGPLFCATLFPLIRSYNRISVFLAFFSLFALFQTLERLGARLRSSARGRVLFAALLSAVAGCGILDQTSPRDRPPYAAIKARYQADADFVRRVEATLSPGSSVLQLPYLPYPEANGLHNLCDYDPLVGYLHSQTLRWSYGAMKGREADRWQRESCALPPEQMVEKARQAGFAGVWLDRRGYPDRGARLEADLRRVLGTPPMASKSGDILFFRLLGSPRVSGAAAAGMARGHDHGHGAGTEPVPHPDAAGRGGRHRWLAGPAPGSAAGR